MEYRTMYQSFQGLETERKRLAAKSAAHALVFGEDRLPYGERDCPAWSSTGGNDGTSRWMGGKPRRPVGTPACYKAHWRWMRAATQAARDYQSWRATGEPVDAPMPGQVDFFHLADA